MSLIRSNYESTSKPVVVIADGWSESYPSITAAAISLGLSPQTLSCRLKHQSDDGVVVTSPKRGKVVVDYEEA